MEGEDPNKISYNMDKWEFIMVEKKHNNLFKTVYDSRMKLLSEFQQAIKLNNKLSTFPPIIVKMIKFANSAKQRHDKMEQIM